MTRTYRSHVEIDERKHAAEVGRELGRMITQRTRTGRGSKGQRLSNDLQDTGRMLASIGIQGVRVRDGRVEVLVGGDGAVRGRSGITNAGLAAVHHSNDPWLALTPAQVRELAHRLGDLGLFKTKPGPPRRRRR